MTLKLINHKTICCLIDDLLTIDKKNLNNRDLPNGSHADSP